MLHLRLLGSPEVRLDGALLSELTSKKALALLFYLATTGRAHLRDELAGLFWYDMPDAQARKNLRNILPTLRALLGDHLTITRHTVRFNLDAPYWLDVEQLCATLDDDRRARALPNMSAAVALYGGEFLTGFYVSDAPAFEEWMLGQRDRLHQLAVRGLGDLAAESLEQAAHQQGLAATRRLLGLEPWNERAHQLQIELLAATGERDRALMQFELCRRALSSEFGIEPAAETQAMYARLKAGLLAQNAQGDERAVGQRAVQPRVEPAPRPTHAGRPELPPLYGREHEARHLQHWIAVERCRLVMLTGRIGMGKTALAQHVTQLLQASDQACTGAAGRPQILWHSCRDMRSAEQLLHDWLDQLEPGGEAARRDGPEARLLEQLRRRRCLLVVDDVERLGDPAQQAGRAAPFWRLIEGFMSSEHQSCLLLVGRELPPLSTYFEATSSAVRSLCLDGLAHEAASMLLSPYGLKGSPSLKSRLIEQYDGVPLFLHLAARMIQGLGHDTLEAYIGTHAPLFDAVRTVLDAEFGALEMLEQTIISKLAATPRAIALPQLHQELYHTAVLPELLGALQRLRRRSLVLTTSEGFMIPRLIRSYSRARVERRHQEPKQWLLQPS